MMSWLNRSILLRQRRLPHLALLAGVVLVAGMSDTDPNAAVILAKMCVDRADAVVAASAAAGLHPKLAGREIELVVENDHGVFVDLVEARSFTDRASALVHEGGRLQ